MKQMTFLYRALAAVEVRWRNGTAKNLVLSDDLHPGISEYSSPHSADTDDGWLTPACTAKLASQLSISGDLHTQHKHSGAGLTPLCCIKLSVVTSL